MRGICFGYLENRTDWQKLSTALGYPEDVSQFSGCFK